MIFARTVVPSMLGAFCMMTAVFTAHCKQPDLPTSSTTENNSGAAAQDRLQADGGVHSERTDRSNNLSSLASTVEIPSSCAELFGCCGALAQMSQFRQLGSVCSQVSVLGAFGNSSEVHCANTLSMLHNTASAMPNLPLPAVCNIGSNVDAGVLAPPNPALSTVEQTPRGDSGVADAGVYPEDCLGLCNRIASCQSQQNSVPVLDESDCARSCAQSGGYAGTLSNVWACASQSCGVSLEHCVIRQVTDVLQRVVAGEQLPPTGYPPGFPYLSGGVLENTSPVGPVRAIALRYALAQQEILNQLRSSLQRENWTITPESVSPRGAIRMNTRRGNHNVSVSVWREGNYSVLQLLYYPEVRTPPSASVAVTSERPEFPARQDIMTALNRVRPAVQACAATQTGNVVVTILFGHSGRVISTRVQSSTFEGSAIPDCVTRVVRGATIPPFLRESLSISHRFVLRTPFATRSSR